MNILIIVDDFSGGAGNITQLLALELSETGNKVSFLLTNKHTVPRYNLEKIKIYDRKLGEFQGNKLIRLLKMIKEVKNIIQQVECKLVISFLDNNNVIACLALMKIKIPIIVSERSNPLVIFPKFPWNYLRRIAYRRADVVTVQFDIFRKFDGGRYEKKCFVTHNIIEIPSVTKKKWDNSIVSFVSIGRYADIKQYDLMIRMFAELYKKVKCIELDLFGTNIVNQTLRILINKYGVKEVVHLHEAIDNVHEELIKHDIYLMTSGQEGFPNALSEALAVGLPAIAFKCHEGIAALVQSGGNGYCIEENNEALFVSAMEKVACDRKLRESFGQQSRIIVKDYNKETVMLQWEECIRQAILNQKNARSNICLERN